MRYLLITVALFAVAGLFLAGQRNDLVRKREAIDAAWAQVDVALKTRADKIPNLVETVKGIAAQEKDVFTNIANARAQLSGARTTADKIAANGQLDSAISRLLVITESYPQLRSSENFLRLQDELAGTENRIAVERRKYNEIVQDYNTNIALFPANVAAMLFGFQRNDAYFRTDPVERTAPKVNFQK
jgi:LemA protein